MNRPEDYCRRETPAERIRPKRTPIIRVPRCSDQEGNNPISDFRAANLVAILRAVSRTDGTCRAVASEAQAAGSTVLASTLAEWIQEGREDLVAGDTETAFARFAAAYDERRRREQ